MGANQLQLKARIWEFLKYPERFLDPKDPEYKPATQSQEKNRLMAIAKANKVHEDAIEKAHATLEKALKQLK